MWRSTETYGPRSQKKGRNDKRKLKGKKKRKERREEGQKGGRKKRSNDKKDTWEGRGEISKDVL